MPYYAPGKGKLCWFNYYLAYISRNILIRKNVLNKNYWLALCRMGLFDLLKDPSTSSLLHISYNDETWQRLAKLSWQDFNTFFLIILISLEYLKVVFITMISTLMASAELPTPGLLKIKIYCNKCYNAYNLCPWHH